MDKNSISKLENSHIPLLEFRNRYSTIFMGLILKVKKTKTKSNFTGKKKNHNPKSENDRKKNIDIKEEENLFNLFILRF